MSMSTKVLFICLDAAERDLVLEWADAGDLPNISALQQRGLWGDAPALPGLGSGALWPSFSTGLNPSRHGRFFSTHMRPGTYGLYQYKFDEDDWHPFWQALSQAGCRVAAIDVPKDTLCKGMNGLQVVDWGVHDQEFPARIWPPEDAKEIIAQLGTDDPVGTCDHYGSTEKELTAFKERLLERINIKGDLACRYLDRGGWDLFLTTFDEPHCVGHRAWHLHDPNHPSHEPDLARSLGDPIKDVYAAIDAQIGKILERAGPETSVILLCGTGMGPSYSGNHLLDDILGRLDGGRPTLGRILSKPARMIWTKIVPANVRAQLRTKTLQVERALITSDRARRKAFAVPHNDIAGAIRINLVGREPQGRVNPGDELDAYCAQLTSDLMELENLDTGKPLVSRVVRTSDLYKGDHAGDFADLFVVWNRTGPVTKVGSPKIGKVTRAASGVRTGDHTPHGLFIASTPRLTAGHREEAVSILDFAPTVASLLGVTLADVEGKPIREIFEAENAPEAVPAE